MIRSKKHPWFKLKGYLHITPKVNGRNVANLIEKITNPDYVKSYAFYPLIHSSIKERRYKKIHPDKNRRAHSFIKNGKIQKTVKNRPLHYATHLDSLIFGYYAHKLTEKYESVLRNDPISDCITAYRKIPIPNQKAKAKKGDIKNKGTIHFAQDVFCEIEKRSRDGCVVLKLDIESFFNRMSHSRIKANWEQLFSDNGKLPADHYNVFNAVTNFSYILLDDLRLKTNSASRRSGFDEKKLAFIRNKLGRQAFFESPNTFRQAIKNKELKLFRHPFRHNGKIVGIPQGLPISSILANLYLLDFDRKVWGEVVINGGGFYRRYSDDIIVICGLEDAERVEKFIMDEICKSEVEINSDKNEKFYFYQNPFGRNAGKGKSVRLKKDHSQLGVPLTYLGFEYFGDRIAIKSANLAKFYRRMIQAIKRKAKRAVIVANKNPGTPTVIFENQIRKLYTLKNLSKTKVYSRYKFLQVNQKGEYSFYSQEKSKKLRSNYLSYVANASRIMKEPRIWGQIKWGHKRVFFQAMSKQLNRQISKHR